MKIFAISDLHLTNSTNKPMDIFGESWVGYWDIIVKDWNEKVDVDDVVLLAGDTSWAMKISEVIKDLQEVDKLNGKKFIIRGNHDYWWSSYSKISSLEFQSIQFIQNNAFKIGDYIVCGTRGWTVPENNIEPSDEDKKIYNRELIRAKLALDSAKILQTNDEKMIFMIHYPPFNSQLGDSDFVKLIGEYQVDKVVYGHIHGKKARLKLVVNKGSTDYYLTSCDILENNLIRLY